MLNFAGQFKFDADLDDDRQEKPRLLRGATGGAHNRRNTQCTKPLRGKAMRYSLRRVARKAAKFFDNLSLPPTSTSTGMGLWKYCRSCRWDAAAACVLDTSAWHNYTWGMRDTVQWARFHSSGRFSQGTPT
jgi:hypothetical protein